MIPEIVDDTFRRFPDGRQICLPNRKGREEYRRRREAMAQRQGWYCPDCRQSMRKTHGLPNSVTFQHDDGRGMGDARQDDRIEDEKGEPMNQALCHTCNVNRGSRRSK